MALYVVIKVSFSSPHVVPASAFKMLLRWLTFVLRMLVWRPKENMGSRVRPRIFGSLMVGTLTLLILMSSSRLTSLEKVVKMVAEDLGADMKRFREMNHLFRTSR